MTIELRSPRVLQEIYHFELKKVTMLQTQKFEEKKIANVTFSKNRKKQKKKAKFQKFDQKSSNYFFII